MLCLGLGIQEQPINWEFMKTINNFGRQRFIGLIALVLPILFAFQILTAHAQGTAFTYQGRLNNKRCARQRQL